MEKVEKGNCEVHLSGYVTFQGAQVSLVSKTFAGILYIDMVGTQCLK